MQQGYRVYLGMAPFNRTSVELKQAGHIFINPHREAF